MTAAPTFFILGAPKCGTTSLYHNLNQHPDICMSNPKEPRYIELQPDGVYENKYKKAFKHWKGEQHRGDASPTYLFVPYVADRLYKYYPNALLVAILRDPVERAHSDWWMHYSRGVEKRSFSEAIQENLNLIDRGDRFSGEEGEKHWKECVQTMRYKKRIREPFYVDIGFYGAQISRYIKLFSKDRLFVLTLTELSNHPNNALTSIYEFLGVSSYTVKPSSDIRNIAMGPMPNFMLKLIRVTQSSGLVRLVPSSVSRIVRKLFQSQSNFPRVDQETIKLLREYYRNDTLLLKKKTGRSFSEWTTS